MHRVAQPEAVAEEQHHAKTSEAQRSPAGRYVISLNIGVLKVQGCSVPVAEAA